MNISNSTQRFITATILATGFWIIFFYFPPFAFSLLLLSILGTILVVEWKKIFKEGSFWYWILMPLYPVLPFLLLIYMNQHACYRNLLYYLFLLVFSFDATAYVVGVTLGRYKIIPFVSPGKTFEGCIGGFFGALVIFQLTVWEQGIVVTTPFSFVFVFAICAIAFLGDIFESMLKRQANIKDSGTILPGHGGFLDRFDAVMMVTFFFFTFKRELAMIFCKS